MIDTGISAAWMGTSSSLAAGVVRRTWGWLRSTPAWREWLGEHVEDDLFVVVYFEDRAEVRTLLRGDTLSHHVPSTYVQAAHESHNLTSFAAETYRDVYAALARRRGLPAPPVVGDDELRSIPSRLP